MYAELQHVFSYIGHPANAGHDDDRPFIVLAETKPSTNGPGVGKT